MKELSDKWKIRILKYSLLFYMLFSSYTRLTGVLDENGYTISLSLSLCIIALYVIFIKIIPRFFPSEKYNAATKKYFIDLLYKRHLAAIYPWYYINLVIFIISLEAGKYAFIYIATSFTMLPLMWLLTGTAFYDYAKITGNTILKYTCFLLALAFSIIHIYLFYKEGIEMLVGYTLYCVIYILFYSYLSGHNYKTYLKSRLLLCIIYAQYFTMMTIRIMFEVRYGYTGKTPSLIYWWDYYTYYLPIFILIILLGNIITLITVKKWQLAIHAATIIGMAVYATYFFWYSEFYVVRVPIALVSVYLLGLGLTYGMNKLVDRKNNAC